MSPDHVKIGGIVIGRRSTFVKTSESKLQKNIGLARQVLDLRERSFYKNCGLEVLTWDSVLERIPVLMDSHQDRKTFSSIREEPSPHNGDQSDAV